MTSRRALIGSALAAPLAAGLGVGGLAASAGTAMGAGMDNLAALAEASGRYYGSAVSLKWLTETNEYKRLLANQCSVWTPEWQMKWGPVEREQGKRDYAAMDAIAGLARDHGKTLRGHTLLFYADIPDWFAGAAKGASAWDKLVAPYITETVARYDAVVSQWDVVNEPIEPNDGEADGMRRSPLLDLFGRDYVHEAFVLARETAPNGKLYLNEHSICYGDDWQEKRRTALLKLLESLIKRGTPIDGLGIQGHLNVGYWYDEARFSSFLDEVTGMGLEIAITELDVFEGEINNAPLDQRYQRAADEVRQVLDVALDKPEMTGLVSWALADPFSWIRTALHIFDNRGLPFDEHFAPTPMHTAIADAFRNARPRIS